MFGLSHHSLVQRQVLAPSLGECVKVLVTGFEPFRKEDINPSWEVCKALPETVSGACIVVKKLPVAFDDAKNQVLEFCDTLVPDVILHLGEAGGRTHISVERIAVNCDDAKEKDNKGQKKEDELIDPHGEDGYFVTLPVKNIVQALKKAGIPAVVSNSAGTYLCNHVLYSALHHTKKNLTQVGFMHLPYLPQQTVNKPGKASMSLDIMVEAVKIAIRTVIE